MCEIAPLKCLALTGHSATLEQSSQSQLSSWITVNCQQLQKNCKKLSKKLIVTLWSAQNIITQSLLHYRLLWVTLVDQTTNANLAAS